MGRGLISGLIWGSLVMICVAVLASLSAPLPERAVPAVAAPQDETERPAGSEMSDPAPEMDEEMAEVAAPTDTAPETPAPTTPAPQLVMSAEVTDPPEREAQPISSIPLAAGSQFNQPVPEGPVVLPGTEGGPVQVPQPVTALPQPVVPPSPDTASAPQPQATSVLNGGTNAVTPDTGATPALSVAAPEPVAEAEPAPLGLPQIETGPVAETETPPPGRPLQRLEEEEVETVADEAPADLPAIEAYAVPFDTSETRPLMAVILIDDPTFPLGRSTLMRFDFPVTFAIDPNQPDAAAAAAEYRAGGFEVMMLAEGFGPETNAAEAADLLTTGLATLSASVGILDSSDGAIQSNRAALEMVVNQLAQTGHGLVAFPRGLNVAEQAATRVDVPAATLFREIDSERERATVITRYLDRAAFAAGQEGAVIVVGHTYSDTVTALFSWALGSRSEGVAMAPVSAVLTR